MRTAPDTGRSELHLNQARHCMSESTSPIQSTLEWDERPQPGVWVIPAPRPRWWLHILLLAATFLSTMVVGARIYANFALQQPAFSFSNDNIPMFPLEWLWQAPAKLMHGLYFSFALMFILLAHEMGHYLYAQLYRDVRSFHPYQGPDSHPYGVIRYRDRGTDCGLYSLLRRCANRTIAIPSAHVPRRAGRE